MNAPKKIEYNEDSSMQRIYNELKKLKYDFEKLGDYGIKIGNIDDNINGYTITDISSFKSSKINTTSENYQINNGDYKIDFSENGLSITSHGKTIELSQDELKNLSNEKIVFL